LPEKYAEVIKAVKCTLSNEGDNANGNPKRKFSNRKEKVPFIRASLAVASNFHNNDSVFNTFIGYCDLWIVEIA
jgi:hypothetical protein